ncbi:MAG: lytic transglycosylase domain-containing protein [Deltaproteobacteria bacterium]|nr:lytic transglycosylase domain-containing protein [Deltaproteobacteria bacterium]
MKGLKKYIYILITITAVLIAGGISLYGKGMINKFDYSQDKKYLYTLDTVRNYTTGLSHIEEINLAKIIIEESSNYDIDPMFVIALIEKESSFFNWARSNMNAIGLMQIRPHVGKYIADDLNIEWKGEHTLFDPYINIKMGIYYFSVLHKRFGDTALALTAYNSGPTYVDDMMNEGRGVPRYFANKVVSMYQNHLNRFGEDQGGVN